MDVMRERLAELTKELHAAEPGSLSLYGATFARLDYLVHFLPRAEQRAWWDVNGKALRKAVFG